MIMNNKEMSEFYFNLFFSNILSELEKAQFKTYITNIIKNQFDTYYFNSNRWFIKPGRVIKAVTQLQSDLGHLTKIWSIDWAYIFHHIFLDYLNVGLAKHLRAVYGPNALVFKWMPLKYIKIAEKVYLRSIRTREPKVFSLDRLIEEGTALTLDNDLKKPRIGVTLWKNPKCEADWWDLTELNYKDKAEKWNKKRHRFEYEYDEIQLKRDLEHLGVKEGLIKVTVGDKVYYV